MFNAERLFVFIERYEQEKFFRWYFPHHRVRFIEYPAMKADKVKAYIKSIRSIPNGDYLFITDSNSYSIEEKKRSICKKYRLCEAEKTFVSQREIESWYLAGLDIGNSIRLGVEYQYNTDRISKEQFYQLKPDRYTANDFMAEILKCYNLEEALKKNMSFNLFHTKKSEALACFSRF